MFEKKLKSGIKKVMIFVLADMVVMVALERYLFRERQNRWNVTRNASPSAFRVSGKKNEGAKKRRK